MKGIIKLVVALIVAITILTIPSMANGEGQAELISDTSETNQKDALSSPGLGLNWNGSVAGDQIPVLYTWRDYYTGEVHTTDYFPTIYQGGIIITPARIAGEPLQNNYFWTTAKGQRILLWKANHA